MRGSLQGALVLAWLVAGLCRASPSEAVRPPVDPQADVPEKAPASPQPAQEHKSETGQIYRLGGDVVPPKMLSKVEPRYPIGAQALRVEGVVILEAVITVSGDVTGVGVIESVHPLVDEAVVQAVRQWRYSPATKNGQPVSCYLTVAVTFNLHGSGPEKEIPRLKKPQDLKAFTQTYYQHPQPNLVGKLIEVFAFSGLAQRPDAAAPYTGFFSEVFAANPAQLGEWQSLISKQAGQVRSILERAVALSKAGGVNALQEHSPAFNDMCWGAFFATGHPVFLQRLVDQLRYFDERENFVLFMTAANAKWSLASNAEHHPMVRAVLKGSHLTADERTRALIADLLSYGPAKVEKQIKEIVQAQRQAGKWQ